METEKKGHGCLIAVLIVAGLLVLAVGGFVYAERYRVQKVDTQTSPDGRFTVTLYQIGEPGFPFGPVDGRIILRGPKGGELERIDTVLYNDGGGIDPAYHWQVTWDKDYVYITLHHADKPEENMYRIPIF